MRTRLAALLLVTSFALCGADRDFERIVKAVESHYGVKRTHIPMMGAANLFLKVAHPAGAKSVQFALFEDLSSARGYGDTGDLDKLFDELAAGGLRPVVRVHSRNNGESTYICTGEVGKSTKMLIATFEPREATVVEVEVNIETLMKTIGSPELAGRTFGIHRDRDDDR